MKTYYHYLRGDLPPKTVDRKGKEIQPGRPPLAVVAIREEDEENFRIAMSRCNPLDNFVKTVGKAKAEGRLHKNIEPAVGYNEGTLAAILRGDPAIIPQDSYKEVLVDLSILCRDQDRRHAILPEFL